MACPAQTERVGGSGTRARVVAIDTLNPIKLGLKLFNIGKENGIREPLKSPPKVPCGTSVKEREGKKSLSCCHYSNSPPLMAYKAK